MFYVSGNHDELVRKFVPITLGEIRVVNEIKHKTVDGSEYLILHGDKFDSIINIAPWLAHLGASAYDLALWLNRRFNQLRLLLGLKYWSLSKYLKLKVKNAECETFKSQIDQYRTENEFVLSEYETALKIFYYVGG